MPVTTRAAALRSQANKATTLAINQTISRRVSCKRTRKYHSRKQRKQLKAQADTTFIEPTL